VKNDKKMLEAVEAGLPIGGKGLLQDALNKGVTAFLAAGLAWYIRKKYYEREKRGSKLDKTYKALFGVDDVDTMEGVVEIIEAHDDDIQEIYDQLEKGKNKRQEIERRVENVKQRINSRHKDQQDD